MSLTISQLGNFDASIRTLLFTLTTLQATLCGAEVTGTKGWAYRGGWGSSVGGERRAGGSVKLLHLLRGGGGVDVSAYTVLTLTTLRAA